jgi:hypothetical protein
MDMSVELTVDEIENQVKNALQSRQPLVITTFTLPHEVEIYIEKVTSVFLRQIQHEEMKDYIIYCIQELSVNAKKANTKRVYFLEQHLDITKPKDYVTGMRNFKKDTFNNISHYLQLQEEKGLYIKIILQLTKNAIKIEIRNNAAITEYEIKRIKNKLSLAQTFNSLEEAMTGVDESEGSGLGLIILVLMMKRLGFGRKCFTVEKLEKETIASITIPLGQRKN